MNMKKHNSTLSCWTRLVIISLLTMLVTVTATADEEFYFYHTDHLGTPQVMTDSQGLVVWEGHYRPFGEVELTVEEVGSNLRFPGQYFDEETGNYYNYFRDYDPTTGRYLQSDPIGLRGGLNTYAYVGGNPLIKIDPKGLSPFDDYDEYDAWDDAIVNGQGPYTEPISIELVASAMWECILCEARCLVPVFSADVAAEGIAQQMDKVRSLARSAALAKKLGKTIATFRTFSGVGTAAGIAMCTITCS